MTTHNYSTQNENIAKFYICIDGDIHDTKEDADITGCVAEVIVDGFFVGSMDDMRKSALAKYNDQPTTKGGP